MSFAIEKYTLYKLNPVLSHYVNLAMTDQYCKRFKEIRLRYSSLFEYEDKKYVTILMDSIKSFLRQTVWFLNISIHYELMSLSNLVKIKSVLKWIELKSANIDW